jgi:hypothetical protein
LEGALAHLEAAARDVREGDAPEAARWRHWLVGLHWYGRVFRGRFARVRGPAGEAQTRWVDSPDFPSRLIHAQARAVVWVNRLCVFFESGDLEGRQLEGLRAALPECDMDSDLALEEALQPGAELAMQRERAQCWARMDELRRKTNPSVRREADGAVGARSATESQPSGEVMATGLHGPRADGTTLSVGEDRPLSDRQEAESIPPEPGESPLRPAGRAPR